MNNREREAQRKQKMKVRHTQLSKKPKEDLLQIGIHRYDWGLLQEWLNKEVAR